MTIVTSGPAMDRATLDQVSFRLNLRTLSNLVMSIPLLGMIACFVTANIFHEDINRTRCPVYNFIPSVSAITGVSPQRYLWRLCMAVHIIPRCLFAVVCYNHWMRQLASVPAARRLLYRRLVRAAFWVHTAELASLAGVTYVSNKENYPVHEKLFSFFLLSCSTYMLLALAVERLAYPHMTAAQRTSARCKVAIVLVYASLLLGLLYYFWKHRFFCEELALSWFSFCEYCICTCIMVFNVLVIRDIPDFCLTVGRPLPVTANGTGAPLKTD
ncbi:post-GPI attachment to proteins factor 2-like [Pollicipes pollicipes]|uniref:post-GPI attachment to proteins factor 2-like n=1 Tax=Pollicipes pollicipes TaxID=41117 RepID=UPI001884B7C0|nr:post-GPI attachment to proteins factor 2-like [Pollicipes pollicipes]XP_037087339.1 post-GPI attachment to proteins factor 2-like [Pollicipes pollicipes]XP_037087340.1 post-GPI attachment to proteins factor 2-like [Pollicipes pollicipes]